MMMKTLQLIGIASAMLAAQAPLHAQAPHVPPGPAVQRIASASAVSTERIGAVVGVVELSDGRVLVNDGVRRRLLLMDTTMKTVEVVLDSLSDVSNTYGTQRGALIPFRGDTTLFIDPTSYAMVVLDPNGKIVRVRSVWRAQDIPYVNGALGFFGWPGTDPRGRVVYRVSAQPAPPPVAPRAGVPFIPMDPDSAFVVAMNLETRKSDTLGVIRTPKSQMRVRQTANGGFNFDQVINPLPSTDEWAILPNGTVAFIRWRDYHIDYLHPDGTITSSGKLPFDWQRLQDEDKKHIVDSVKVAQERTAQAQFVNQLVRWVNLYGKAYPKNYEVPAGFVPQPGLAKDWVLPKGLTLPSNYIYACAPGETPSITMPGGGTVSGNVQFNTGQAPAGALPPIPSGANVTIIGGPPGGGPPGGGPGGPGGPGGATGFGGAMPSCIPAGFNFSTGGTPPAPTPRVVHVVAPDELPDYKPPFSSGAARADMDGNLWIRINPMTPMGPGAVFDVVNPEGVLVQRLQLPLGYSIVGFGKGRVVYVSMRDMQGVHVARVRLK